MGDWQLGSGWRAVAGAVLLAAVAATAQAETVCTPSNEPGVERCVSGLPAASLARMHQQQHASNWCWAASISMVLRRYGVQATQENVVRAHYGSAVNLGAGPAVIAGLLNRSWRDGAGRSLTAAAVNVSQPSLLAPEVLADLDDDRPLLVGAQQHATVLVQVVYDRSTHPRTAAAAGLRLVRAMVLDPADQTGVRDARAGELQPEFLARVEVHADEAAMAMAAVQPRLVPAAARTVLVALAGNEAAL
jgi:hypothetical protein